MSDNSFSSGSNYPDLHQFMHNLYMAGMGIERVIEKGYEFALTLHSMQEAAKMVRHVSEHMGISLNTQRDMARRAGGTHG